MKGITKIYLVTNCYNNPNKIYIGKTKDSRESDHRYTYGNNIIYTEIDKINSLDRKDWEPLETFYINYFKFLGFEVVNKRKKGGTGPEFHQEEVKEKIRKANKGNKNLLGFKYSEEMKNRMRKPKSEEHKNKIKLANTGKIRTEEMVNKLKKPHKIGTGENISISMSKHPIICLETGEIFRNAEILSKKMNISATLIRRVCDKEKKAKSFTFKYVK